MTKYLKTANFNGSSGKSLLDQQQRDLLSSKISDLSLEIPGTRLETLIDRLYQELEKAGLSFRPRTYLSDEWGCPHGVPVIGIPFYLADSRLGKLEGQLTGIKAETESETMMYLRHEAGHAFNYAYRFYTRTRWRLLFGPFSHPYEEEYKPIPFSARFVRHIPGWYAQKHPDDDFAETFAVWLTPGSEWRKKYSDTPALSKLVYINRLMNIYGRKPPSVIDEKLDRPVQKLTMTLDTWYEVNRKSNHHGIDLPNIINEDLRRLFPETEGRPAAEILQTNSLRLIREVNEWTGMDRQVLRSLFYELKERVRTLDLKVGPGKSALRIMNIAIFLTTLVMTYELKDRFIDL